MRLSLALLPLLAAAPLRAEDWLLSAQRAARSVSIPGESAPEAVAKSWVPFEPASRLFRADIPPEGWRASEEEDASGFVVRLFIEDSASAAIRGALSVRLVDRDAPGFVPAKQAVEAMRKGGEGRETSPVNTLRVGAGLARIFEITQTRRLPGEEGPALPEELHQYVAVIPRGEAYYLVRLVTSRASYLEYRDDFVRFLKSLKPIGAR